MINAFKNLLKKISDLIRTEQDWANFAHLAEQALKENDWDKYQKYNNPENRFLDYENKLASTVGRHCNIENFKKFEKEIISINKNTELFYQNALNWAVAPDNIDIIKYIYNSYSDLVEIHDDLFNVAIKNKSKKTMEFLLFEKNFSISLKVRDFIKGNNGTKTYYYEVEELIKQRDDYNKLKNAFKPSSNSDKKMKI